jgi:sec-independent protein translocase protein TatB
VFNLQGSEIIVILLLALVVLGPEKLPDAIRKFSQTYGEIKKMGTGFQSELKSALDEPMREMRETADLVKRSADPARIAEEAENEAQLRAATDATALTAAAEATAFAEATDVPVDPSIDEVGSSQQPNGKKVNQIALSMARGPIDPKPTTTVAPGAEIPTEGVADSVPLTAVREGAAAMLAPPPSGTVPADTPPPQTTPQTTPPLASAEASDDADLGAP